MTIDADKQNSDAQALSETSSSAKPKTAQTPAANKNMSANRWLLALTLLLAFSACGACGYLWYLHIRSVQSHSEEITALKRTLRTLDEHPTITEFKTLSNEQNARFAQQLQELSVSTNTLEESVAKTLDFTGRSNREWVLSETEYLIRMAHTQLQLMHNPKSAVIALLSADQRIATLSDPRLIPLRKSIADDITRLNALAAPDVDGALLRLSIISRQLPGLPLATVSYHPNNKIDDSEAEAYSTQPKEVAQHWWVSAVEAFKTFVGYREDGKPNNETLSKNNRYYLDQILLVEIESARQAVLRLDQHDFEYRLSRIKALLDKHYDQSDKHVIKLKQDVVELQQLPIFLDLPMPSDSLKALHQLTTAPTSPNS